MNKIRIDPKVGDRLIVPGGTYRPERTYIVVAVRRIKFDVVSEDQFEQYTETGRGHVTTWRKDTAQQEGDNSFNGPVLYSPETLALDKRRAAAREYLNNGLRLDTYRMNTDVIDTLTLANLIREHLGLEPL